MARFVALLALGAIVLGIAGLAVTTERSSAQQLPNGDRFDLSCEQTADPTGAGTKGEVTCTLNVDLPDPLSDLSLTIVVTYVDVDGSGDPNPGDQLQCISVTAPSGNTLFDRCRADDPASPPVP